MSQKNKAREHRSKEVEELLNELDPLEEAKHRKKMLLAARIDEELQKAGMKKKDLAERIGKKPAEISKLLSGTHNLTHDTLIAIEEALGVDLIGYQKEEELREKVVAVKVSMPASRSLQEEIQSGIAADHFSWIGASNDEGPSTERRS